MSQSPGGPSRYNEIAGTSLDGLKGISDGIFSVGMTLLVSRLSITDSGRISSTKPGSGTSHGSCGAGF